MAIDNHFTSVLVQVKSSYFLCPTGFLVFLTNSCISIASCSSKSENKKEEQAGLETGLPGSHANVLPLDHGENGIMLLETIKMNSTSNKVQPKPSHPIMRYVAYDWFLTQHENKIVWRDLLFETIIYIYSGNCNLRRMSKKLLCKNIEFKKHFDCSDSSKNKPKSSVK